MDTERPPALPAARRDAPRRAGIERSHQHVRAFLDQALGPGARGIDIGLGVGVHQLDVDAEHLPDHAGGEVGALLAGLADEALHAGPRQQDADFEPGPLAARDAERGKRGCGERGIEGAAADGHDVLP